MTIIGQCDDKGIRDKPRDLVRSCIAKIVISKKDDICCMLASTFLRIAVVEPIVAARNACFPRVKTAVSITIVTPYGIGLFMWQLPNPILVGTETSFKRTATFTKWLRLEIFLRTYGTGGFQVCYRGEEGDKIKNHRRKLHGCVPIFLQQRPEAVSLYVVWDLLLSSSRSLFCIQTSEIKKLDKRDEKFNLSLACFLNVFFCYLWPAEDSETQTAAGRLNFIKFLRNFEIQVNSSNPPLSPKNYSVSLCLFFQKLTDSHWCMDGWSHCQYVRRKGVT